MSLVRTSAPMEIRKALFKDGWDALTQGICTSVSFVAKECSTVMTEVSEPDHA